MSHNILHISDLVTYQLPDFVTAEFDCFVKFYEEYYKSLELTGGPLDVAHNFLDEKDVDNLKKHNLVQELTLAEDLTTTEQQITLDSVYGLQPANGVIKINDEIIFYESINKQTNTLLGCKRGYSATTELNTQNTTFDDSVAAEHSTDDKVYNLTNLFKFLVLRNYQEQYLSGFPYESVIADIGEDTLIKNIKDFYSYKGTSLSVEFLFRTLYAEEITLRYPKDYVIKTSYSDWTVDDVIKVEQITGNPYNLVGYELFQTDASGEVTDVLLIDQILVNNISNYASGNKNIYEIRLNVLERTNFIIPADSLLRRDLTSTDTIVTVDSTIGFPEENGIIQIDDEYITYRFKSFNQFFDCARGAYDTVAVSHTASNNRVTTTEFLYGTSPNNQEVVKLRLLGVLSGTTINDGSQYYEEGDIIKLSQDGAEDLRPQFTTWRKNESGDVASSSNGQIDDIVSQFTGDVTSVFKTDDYAYVASTGLPTHPVGPFLGVGNDIRNQYILKSIPLSTQINTKTQFTDDKPVGIFVNGVEAMSRQGDETVSFGPIDSVQILQSGFGFETDTQPIFRISNPTGSNATFEANIVDGKVTSINVTSGGSGYTQDEDLEVAYGFDATASVANTTDIANGQIKTITVTNGGSDYVLPPNVEIFDITGRGQNAFGIARVQNGAVVGIDVLNGGKDFYDISNIRVNIISKGSGVVARAISKKWKFDRVFKINNVLDVNTGNYVPSTTSRSDAGNGYLFQSRNAAFALQYGYAFNPKLLRFSLNDNVTGPNANYSERGSNYTHSPILGWAYDGHPIYGPYSYVDPLDNTSSIARMTSSYVLASSGSSDRPSTTTYPLGSFIQDYTFSLGQGTLDRSNGRFCVTPEFPDGTYAYFITVDNFSNPVYPYILGETYNSVPAQNNLLISHIQSESILPADARRLRTANTPSKGFDANLLVDFTDRGIIDSFEVYGGNSNFKTTDYLFINNDDTEGSRSYAKVSKLVGVTASGVSYRVNPAAVPSGLTLDANGRPTLPYPLTITGREFTMLNPAQKTPVNFLVTMTTTEPHGLSLGDQIDITLDRPNFTGAMTIKTRVSDYQTITYAPPSISTELQADVSFNSSAINVTVADDFRVNDYIKINDEILKITSIDTNLDQLQVERSQFNTKLRLHATGNTVSLYIPESDPDYRIAVGDTFVATGISATIYNINKANKTIELRVASGSVTTSTVAVDQSTPDTRNITIQSVTPKQSFWEFDVTNTGNYFRRNLTSADFSFDFVKGTEYTFDMSDGTLNGRVLNFATDSEKINKLQDVAYTGTPGTAGAQVVITKAALLRPNVSRLFYYDSDNTVVYSGAYLNVLRLPDSTQTIRSIPSDNQFSFVSPRQPEFPEYIGVVSYNTNSKSAVGTIADIELIDGGEGYKKLPKVDGVVHTDLDNAVFSFNIVSGIVQDDVSILLRGRRYDPNTTALKVVSQTGTGAVLVPSVTNGEIVNVVVSEGGEGYLEDDYIVAYDTSANIFPTSSSIGKIRNIRFTNYGSQFNPDKTFSKNLIFEKKVIVTELSGNLFKKNEKVEQNNGFSGIIKNFQEIGNKSYLLTVEEVVGSIAPTSTTVSTLNGTIQGTTARVVTVTDPEVIANVGALIEKVGYFDSDFGKLSSSSQKITDSYYYQDFSYVIRSTRSLSEYRDKVYDTTHPLGFKLFGEVSVENDIDFDDTATGLPFSIGLPDDHSDNTVIITLDPVNVESDIVFKKYELSTINSAVMHKYPGQGAALLNFLENQIEAVQIADLSATFSGSRNTYALTTTDGNFPTATKNTSVVLALNEIFQEPYEIIDVDGISYNASVATITTSSDHGYATTSGTQTYPNNVYVHIDNVTTSGNLNFNDKFEIYDVPTSNSIRVLFNNPNGYLTNNDPGVCADVRSTIDNLVSILTYQLNDPTRALPISNYGIWLDPDKGPVSANRHRDGANLIEANRQEIIDRANAQISIDYPDFYYPNDPQTTSTSRYKDAYRLIQQNRQEIIDDSFAEIAIQHPTFVNPNSDKCKRDIGYFIDAVSLDVHTGGNVYARKFLQQYFIASGTALTSNGLSGEVTESITAFNKARDMMKLAITNRLTVKDLTITPGNAEYWGTAVGTPTDATYDPATGVSTITIAGHGLSNGDQVLFKDNSFTFTCGMDGDVSKKTYPRVTDGNFNTAMTVSNVTTDTFEVNVGASPLVTFDVTAANYDPESGDVELTIGSHTLSKYESIKLRDESLVFTCDLDNNATEHAYPKTTILSETIESADYDPVNGVLTVTVDNHGWEEGDLIKFDDNSVVFTCARDGNTTQHSYPRPGSDPYAGKWIPIFDVYEDTFKVQVGVSSDTSAHTFVSATTNGLKKKKDKVYDTAVPITAVTATTITINVGSSTDTSTHTFVPGSSLSGAVISGGDYVHTFVSAAEDAVVLPVVNNTITNTDPGACADVQSNIDNLVGIVTFYLDQGSLVFPVAIPNELVGVPSGGEAICKRDLGFVIDAVIDDMRTGGNSNIVEAAEFYLDGTGLLVDGLAGEVDESVTAFNKARDMMKLAVTNQLYEKDFTILPDFLSTSGTIDAIDLTNATMLKGQFKYENNNLTLFEAPKKGTTFNSIFYKFVSAGDDARYSYKVKNILFDGTTTSYPLYYLSGANLVTETDENLLVFIDGVLQIYGESYTIDRSVNPNTINFTEAHASDRHFFAYSFSKYKILNNIASRFDNKERVFDFRYLTENVQPPDVHQVLILLDGVPQVEGTTYTVNENIITFSEAPQEGKKCHMLYFYGKTFDKTVSIWNGEVFQTIDDINERTPDGCRYFNKRNRTFEYIKKGDYINIDGETSKEIISIDQKILENTDNLVYTAFVYTDSAYIRGKNAVAQATVSGVTVPGGNTVTASGTVSVSGTFGVPPVFNYQVTGVVVNDPGLEYDVAPIVLFQTKCNNPGKGAEAYATVVNGKIQSVTVTNPGSGYTEAPDVIFAKKYEIIKPQTPLFVRKETIVNVPLNEDDVAVISPGFTADSTQVEEEFTIPLIYTDISLTKNIVLEVENKTNRDPARPALAYTLQTFDQNKFKYEPLNINDPLTAYLGTNVNIENVSRYAPSLTLGDFTTHAGRSVGPSDPAVINYGEDSYMAFGFTLPNGAGINDDVIQIDGNLTNVPSSGFIELGNELIDASRISGPTTPGVQAAVDVTAVGYIESVNVSNTGSGYETAPTVTVASPGGTDATITATLTSSGTFKRFDITNGGSGYTYPPDVTLGGGMTGLSATAEITNGVVTGIVLDGTTYDTTNSDDIFSFGAGTSIAQNGTGTGEQGGFNVGGTHLRFGDSDGGTREVVLEPLDTTGIDTIRIYAIRGNDTNGGEIPEGDSGDESLRIAYQIVPSGNPINNNWVDAGIIIWDSSDDGTYGNPSAGLDNYDLSLPAGASGTRVFFKLYQPVNSGSIYDNYGILSVSFLDVNTVYTDSTVTLTNNPLDNGGLGATADVYLNKEVQSLTVSDGGTGYDPATIYNLTFTGGNPTSTAVGTANAKFEFDITITNPGDGYHTATVTFTGGGGSNLAADLTVDPNTTQITGATITNQGTGYTSIPTYQVSNPDDVWNFNHIRARERGANGTTAFSHAVGKYVRLAWRG